MPGACVALCVLAFSDAKRRHVGGLTLLRLRRRPRKIFSRRSDKKGQPTATASGVGRHVKVHRHLLSWAEAWQGQVRQKLVFETPSRRLLVFSWFRHSGLYTPNHANAPVADWCSVEKDNSLDSCVCVCSFSFGSVCY